MKKQHHRVEIRGRHGQSGVDDIFDPQLHMGLYVSGVFIFILQIWYFGNCSQIKFWETGQLPSSPRYYIILLSCRFRCERGRTPAHKRRKVQWSFPRNIYGIYGWPVLRSCHINIYKLYIPKYDHVILWGIGVLSWSSHPGLGEHWPCKRKPRFVVWICGSVEPFFWGTWYEARQKAINLISRTTPIQGIFGIPMFWNYPTIPVVKVGLLNWRYLSHGNMSTSSSPTRRARK